MRKILILFSIAASVTLVYMLMRPWNLTISIQAGAPDLKFDLLVDGKHIGYLDTWRTLKLKIPNGNHSIELVIDGKTVLKKTIDLPVLSMSKSDEIELSPPPVGDVSVNWRYSKGVYDIKVRYEGPYPYDSYFLRIDGDKLLSKTGNFKLRSRKKSLKFTVGVLKNDIELIERSFEVSRNRGNLSVVLSGDERLKRIAKVRIDGALSSSREVEFGKHDIRIEIDGISISTSVLLEEDSTVILNLPRLPKVYNAHLEVKDGSVFIQWNVENGLKPSGYEISWNGSSLNVSGTSVELPLEKSTVVYTIKPVFFDGRITGEGVELVKPSFPRLIVDLPSESSSCILKIHVSSSAPYEIFLNGDRSGETLNLMEGENYLKVIAKDRIGQVSTFEGSIVCDRTPPDLSYSIENGFITFKTNEESKIEVEGFGEVNPGSPLSLRSLPPEFEVIATDVIGNSTSLKVSVVGKPEIEATMIDLDEMRIELRYDLPRDGFELIVDGIETFLDGDSTVLNVKISKTHRVSAAAVYGNLRGEVASIDLENPFVDLIEGQISSLKPGYYLVENGVKLADVDSTDVEIFVKKDAFVQVEGEISGLKFSAADGNWDGLRLYGARISDVEISKAGVCVNVLKDSTIVNSKLVDCGIGVKTTGSKINVESSNFEGCGLGMDVSNSNLSVSKSNFKGCGTGVRIKGSRAVIDSSSFTGNDTGFELLSSSAWIYRSKFISNLKGIKTFKSSVYIYSTDFKGNKIAVDFYRHNGINALDTCCFTSNDLDVVIKGEADIFTNSDVRNVVDGKTDPFWLDDRGVLRKRGKLLKVGDR